MRWTFFHLLVLLLLIQTGATAQMALRTEEVSCTYRNITAATLGDTIVVGPAHLVGLAVNTSAASDTIQVKNGRGVVATVILGGTASAVPVFIPYNTRLDTSLIVTKKKLSDVTVIYRKPF